MKSITTFLNAFVNLVYPPHCLHCKVSLYSGQNLLCPSCIDLLELINCDAHCPKCFLPIPPQKKHACANCRTKTSSLTALGAAFDYKGPASTLVRKLKYGNMSYLSEGLSGYMAAQFVELDWPIPDLIVPVPQSFTHWLARGYNQAELLSDNLSLILERPVQLSLNRKSDDYSQAGLNHDQRLKLNGNTICLKRNQNIQDKTILLIDDVFTTGTTLQKCAESLLEGCPNSIYALTACRTVTEA